MRVFWVELKLRTFKGGWSAEDPLNEIVVVCRADNQKNSYRMKAFSKKMFQKVLTKLF
jgi:hypothetical protein